MAILHWQTVVLFLEKIFYKLKHRHEGGAVYINLQIFYLPHQGQEDNTSCLSDGFR
jgi:hypothetical protein